MQILICMTDGQHHLTTTKYALNSPVFQAQGVYRKPWMKPVHSADGKTGTAGPGTCLSQTLTISPFHCWHCTFSCPYHEDQYKILIQRFRTFKKMQKIDKCWRCIALEAGCDVSSTLLGHIQFFVVNPPPADFLKSKL